MICAKINLEETSQKVNITKICGGSLAKRMETWLVMNGKIIIIIILCETVVQDVLCGTVQHLFKLFYVKPFNSCLNVVLWIEKGDHLKNSHVLVCPNKQRFY